MPSMVSLANSGISIAQACRWAGMDIPEGYGNRKTWCPFGHISHPDGGVEAAFRLYEDTNSAYCFACSRAWSPAALMAEFWDCTRAEAAQRMCEMAGLREPGWQDKWEQLQHEPPPDTAALAEALKRWCARVRGPDAWESDQFDPRFAVPLAACFGVLTAVVTRKDAETWVDGCKVIMGPLLRS